MKAKSHDSLLYTSEHQNISNEICTRISSTMRKKEMSEMDPWMLCLWWQALVTCAGILILQAPAHYVYENRHWSPLYLQVSRYPAILDHQQVQHDLWFWTWFSKKKFSFYRNLIHLTCVDIFSAADKILTYSCQFKSVSRFSRIPNHVIPYHKKTNMTPNMLIHRPQKVYGHQHRREICGKHHIRRPISRGSNIVSCWNFEWFYIIWSV